MLELDGVEEAEELDPEDVDGLDELCVLDELGVDELLPLSLLLLSDELSLFVLLSEFPLLSELGAELLTSVFSPLFSGFALGSLSLSE